MQNITLWEKTENLIKNLVDGNNWFLTVLLRFLLADDTMAHFLLPQFAKYMLIYADSNI